MTFLSSFPAPTGNPLGTMKSYLKFLSRNKLYTAIEAVGLIVSLAFVIMIACYTWQQFAVTREAPDYQRVYSLNEGREGIGAIPGEMSVVMDRIPGVEAAGRIDTRTAGVIYDGERIKGNPTVYLLDPEMFEFFPQEIVSGSVDALRDLNQVMLGESFARKISREIDPVGRQIIIGRDTCTVAGIIRAGKRSMLKEGDLYRGMAPDRPSSGGGYSPFDLVLIRLSEESDPEAVRTLIDTLVTREFYDLTYKYRKAEHSMTMPFREIYFSSKSNSSSCLNTGNVSLVYVLVAIGILLLASALFNYINLSIALAGKRAKEMAIRSTLGETKGRITFRYILESVLFVAVCLVFALLLAKTLEPVFNRYVAGRIGLDVALSAPYLAGYAMLAVLVGVVSGLVPAWMNSRHDSVSIIKGEYRRETKTVFSKVFIIIQNVITVVLISLALVMELQYKHLVNMPLGADVDNLYFLSCDAVTEDALRSKPYVERIGKADAYPGKHNARIGTLVDGQMINIGLFQCDEAAFEMLGFDIVKDYQRPMMNSVWLTESAVAVLPVDDNDPALPEVFRFIYQGKELGGIVKDFAVDGPSKITSNQVGAVVIDALEGQSTAIIKLNRYDSEVRSELEEIGRQESIRLTGEEKNADRYGLISDLIERDLEETHNFIVMIALFMLLSTIISLLGLVAMSSYYSGMQTKDIAIRKVFGSTASSETRRAVTEYIVLVGIAILIGIPLAVFLAERYLRQFYYRIEDYWWVFPTAAAITLAISFLAILWQVSKAARTDPATELKKE